MHTIIIFKTIENQSNEQENFIEKKIYENGI